VKSGLKFLSVKSGLKFLYFKCTKLRLHDYKSVITNMCKYIQVSMTLKYILVLHNCLSDKTSYKMTNKDVHKSFLSELSKVLLIKFNK